jgi:RimJ/RimL family protein N-acetyltransferase
VNRQPSLVGERVEARPLVEDDFAEPHAAAADPLLWEQHPNTDRRRQNVLRTSFDDHLASGGALAIIERVSGALIGATRYDNFDPERSEVEIGWTFLARPHWGRCL